LNVAISIALDKQPYLIQFGRMPWNLIG